MFKTNYKGKMELLGSGVYTSNWLARRSVIKIGDQKIRNVLVSDYMDTILENAVEDESLPEISVSVGWTLFQRWVLAIKYNNEVEREGMFLFVAGLITQVFVVGMAAAILGLIAIEILPGFLGGVVSFALVIYVLITAVLDIKAWLFPF